MKPKTRSIVFFVGLCVALAALATVEGGFWFFRSHRESVAITAERADLEFSKLRARFSNEQPILDMTRREASGLPVSPSLKSLRSFHTVIFDTRGSQRIVHIAVPYWFARLFAGRDREFRWLGQLTFLDDTEFDPE